MALYQETLWGEPEKIQEQETSETNRFDPRSDKPDHEHWRGLLWNCWHLEKDLYYLLHGIRCGGAEIKQTMSSYQLLQGEWSLADWEDIRQNRLSKYRDQLVNIFKLSRAGSVINEELPAGIFN